jgi:methionyl-tRNA formyltransferase
VALSPDLPVADALRRVRASGPTAPSRAALGGRLVVVERLSPHAGAMRAGLVAADVTGTVLGFADGAAVIERLRPAGKGSMDGASFARGARFGPESRWEGAS